MTVTDTPSTESPGAAAPLKEGRVVAIAGPVVDVEFPAARCPRSTPPCR